MNIGDLAGMLQQYMGGSAPSADQAGAHYDQVSQSVPQGTLATAITSAMQSNETPDFEKMIAGAFSNGNSSQQASILNTLIASAGPMVLSSVLSGGALSGLTGMLGHGGQITPQQASQIPPDAVQEIAKAANQQDPSVVSKMGSIFAEHPTLVKTLGAGAMILALRKIAEMHQS